MVGRGGAPFWASSRSLQCVLAFFPDQEIAGNQTGSGYGADLQECASSGFWYDSHELNSRLENVQITLRGVGCGVRVYLKLGCW